MKRLITALFCLSLFSGPLLAQQRFADLVGSVNIQPVKQSDVVQVPFITWGGDVATFLANGGGLTTTSDSIYGKMDLKLQLTKGDNFVEQVKNYLSGKTPYLRGTMRMLGQASEVLGSSPATKPVVILQLSWSAGDHIVARKEFKKLNDLARPGVKVKIACQQGGPHVGLLYDSLAAANIKRSEVDIQWVTDLTGPKGPAEAFRRDPSIDACCVITPDLIGLTGGIDNVGTGAEGTVEGAHMLNSTQSMSRSIADVYAVRSDWYQSNRQHVEKFVAGYLKATSETVKMRREFEMSKKMSEAYKSLLMSAQSIFGIEVIPTLEVDAHGLLLDCGFVGLPGQIAFFEDRGNLSGFTNKMKDALDLAVGWEYAKTKNGFDPPGLDYKKIANLAGIPYEQPKTSGGIVAEDFNIEGNELEENVIVSFTINFDPNQSEFLASQYGAEFRRAIQAASTFGNAVVEIRGHADPTKALREVVTSGIQKKLIKRTGTNGDYKYFVNGKPLDLNQTDQITKLIQSGAFEGNEIRPQRTMQSALNLSKARANSVKQSLVDYASQLGSNLDATQIQPTGAGITEPIVPRPTSNAEAGENRRVEFRIIRVPAEELIDDSDFDF